MALALSCHARQGLVGGLTIRPLVARVRKSSFHSFAVLSSWEASSILASSVRSSSSVFAVLDEQPATAFQDGLGRFISLFLNGAPGGGHGVVQVFRDVKTIHDRLRMGQFGFGDRVIGVPHIGAAHLDIVAPGRAALGKPDFQAFLATVRQHIEDDAQFRGRNDQAKVTVALVNREFIQAKLLHKWVATLVERFFAQRSKMPRTVSWLRPSLRATWAMSSCCVRS